MQLSPVIVSGLVLAAIVFVVLVVALDTWMQANRKVRFTVWVVLEVAVLIAALIAAVKLPSNPLVDAGLSVALVGAATLLAVTLAAGFSKPRD